MDSLLLFHAGCLILHGVMDLPVFTQSPASWNWVALTNNGAVNKQLLSTSHCTQTSIFARSRFITVNLLAKGCTHLKFRQTLSSKTIPSIYTLSHKV